MEVTDREKRYRDEIQSKLGAGRIIRLAHAKAALVNIRDGCRFPENEWRDIERALGLGVTYKQIGLTPAELIQIKTGFASQEAYLAKTIPKLDERLAELDDVIFLCQAIGKNPSDLIGKDRLIALQIKRAQSDLQAILDNVDAHLSNVLEGSFPLALKLFAQFCTQYSNQVYLLQRHYGVPSDTLESTFGATIREGPVKIRTAAFHLAQHAAHRGWVRLTEELCGFLLNGEKVVAGGEITTDLLDSLLQQARLACVRDMVEILRTLKTTGEVSVVTEKSYQTEFSSRHDPLLDPQQFRSIFEKYLIEGNITIEAIPITETELKSLYQHLYLAKAHKECFAALVPNYEVVLRYLEFADS